MATDVTNCGRTVNPNPTLRFTMSSPLNCPDPIPENRSQLEIDPSISVSTISIGRSSSNSADSNCVTPEGGLPSPALSESPSSVASSKKGSATSASMKRSSNFNKSTKRQLASIPYWFINLSGPSRPTNKINGSFQSPINLTSSEAVHDSRLLDMPLQTHYQLTRDFELINTGYVLQLSMRPRQSQYYITA